MTKILQKLTKLQLVIKSLKKIYRYGGYTLIKVSEVNHGEVLKDKKVLITGGSSGIGLSIAKKCLKEGAKVVITGRNADKLNKAITELNSPHIKCIVWDISNISELESGFANALELFEGDIDILVNNAGIVNGIQFLNVTEEIWDKTYTTNSKGLFFITQELSKYWITNRNNSIKKIINISSQGGFVGATYPYRMTKWDVVGLTQGLGLKLIPYGIIVNGIAPGFTLTEAVKGNIEQKENLYCSQNPIERIALPEEIAELALFLMSDAANFIVGQTIVCDGGYSLK